MNRVVVFFGNQQMSALCALYQRFIAPGSGKEAAFISVEAPSSQTNRTTIEAADCVVAQISGLQNTPAIEKPAGPTQWHMVPEVSAAFLWPFGGQPHPRNHPDHNRFRRNYPAALGDAFLNRMIHRGVDSAEAAKRYLAIDIASIVDLDDHFAAAIEGQRRRDEITGYDFAEIIVQRFRDEYLFLTPFHLSRRFTLLLARKVFQNIGVEKQLLERLESLSREIRLPTNALPIHPSVIRHFRLSYVSEEQHYPYFDDGGFTFAEYAFRYMQFGSERSSPLAAGLAERAFLLAAQDRTDEALEAMKQASAIESNSEWHSRLSRTLARRGKLFEAEHEIRTAIALAPNDAAYCRELSHILANQQRIEEAIVAARNASALAPNDPRNHFRLGALLAGVGELEAAETAFRMAAAGEPNSGIHYAELARVLMRLNRATEGLAMARRSVELEPTNATFHFRFAEMLMHLGDLETAEKEILAAIALKPTDGVFHARLGQLLMRINRGEEALLSSRKAIELSPENPHIRAGMANLLAIAGKYDEAESMMRTAISRAPNVPVFYMGMSNIMAGQGRPDEAVWAARKSVEIDSKDPGVRASLGRLLIRVGNLSEAEQELREAVRLAPNNAAFYNALSQLMAQQNRTDEAVAAARKSVELKPENEDARAHLRRLLNRDAAVSSIGD